MSIRENEYSKTTVSLENTVKLNSQKIAKKKGIRKKAEAKLGLAVLVLRL